MASLALQFVVAAACAPLRPSLTSIFSPLLPPDRHETFPSSFSSPNEGNHILHGLRSSRGADERRQKVESLIDFVRAAQLRETY